MGDFKLGDLVWAKMKGFPPWPGVVVDPPKEMKKQSAKKNVLSHCIFFFGSRNYGWIEDAKLKPYEEYKEEFKKTAKSAGFKDACQEIEDYAQKGDDSIFNTANNPEDAFDRLIESANSTPGSETISKIKSKRASVENGDADEKSTPKQKSVVFQDDSKSGGAGKSASGGKSILKKRKSVEGEIEGSGSKKSKEKAGTPKLPKKRPSSSSETKPKKKVSKFSDADTTTPPDLSREDDSLSRIGLGSPHRKWPGSNLLERPLTLGPLESPKLNLEHISDTLRNKNIVASSYKFGFLGLGIMGSALVKNLLNSGHKVVVWNRSPDKSYEFEKAGAEVALTPSDVASSADIICCCVSNANAAKELVFGNCGLLSEMTAGKSLVQMTGIDVESSQDIADGIASVGGRYLEAQIHGSKNEAEEGSLIFLTGGNRSLFEDCTSFFEACGKRSLFLGDVGSASKLYVVLQLVTGITLGGLAEGLALAEKAGLVQSDVIELLQLSVVSCPLINEKSQAILQGNYATNMALGHLQKDIKLALNLADSYEQPVPLAATANEVYKHAKRLGYGDHDAAAVYVRARF